MQGRKLQIESFENRETPALLTGGQLMASALAATPAMEHSMPLGGSVSVNVTQTGTTIHETFIWLGPNGNTVLSEDATLTLNVRTGEVNGSILVTDAAGHTVTGSLTGMLTGSTFEETTIFTGMNGESVTQQGTYVGGENSLASTSSWTGSQGNSITRSGVVSVDTTNNSISISGNLTGPNGKSVDWDHTFS